MAFHIRDPKTDAVVRELAARRGVSLTDAVRLAAEAELARDAGRTAGLLEKVRRLQERVAALLDSGLKADKAFYDDLSGEL